MTVEVIKGQTIIENLEIHGLIDSHNFTEEIDSMVFVNEDSEIESELIFENPVGIDDIITQNLNIGTLNGHSRNNLRPNSEVTFNQDMYFDSLSADEVVVEGDFEGVIEDFDLLNYDHYRFSLSKEQNISGVYKIENGNLQYLLTEEVEGIDFEFIKPFIKVNENMMKKFYEGNLDIDDLRVNGSIFITNHLNKKNFSKLLENAFWLDRDNNLKTPLHINGEAEFKDVNFMFLNQKDYHFFLGDVIFKNETYLEVWGEKTFGNGFEVENLNTKFINNILVEDILTWNKNQVIFGHVIVNGDVWVEENLQTYSVNDVSIDYLKGVFRVEGDKYVINGKCGH